MVDSVKTHHVEAWLGQSEASQTQMRCAVGVEHLKCVGELLRRHDSSCLMDVRRRLFLHPRRLHWSVRNPWLYAHIDRIYSLVCCAMANVVVSDSKYIGRHMRGHVKDLLNETAAALSMLEYLNSIDTRDMCTDADPLRSVREGLSRAIGMALHFVHASCGDVQSDRHKVVSDIEQIKEIDSSAFENDLRPINRALRDDETILSVGSGRIAARSIANDTWSIEPQTLAKIGSGYIDYIGAPAVSSCDLMGYQALRLCLQAQDPIVGNFVALRTIALVERAENKDRQHLREIQRQFWTTKAPAIVSTGGSEIESLELWIERRDPGKLVAAHASLLEAVARPLLSQLVAIGDIAKGRKSVDSVISKRLDDLIDALKEDEQHEIFGLALTLIHKDVRNAHSHAGVIKRTDGGVNIEDGRGAPSELDLKSLEYDHGILRSLLMGIEAGLACSCTPGGMSASFDRTAIVNHTRDSAEFSLKAIIYTAGCGRVNEFKWDENRLTIELERDIDEWHKKSIIESVAIAFDREVLPEELIIRGPRSSVPHARSKKRRRRRKRKGRRNRKAGG